MATQPHQNVNRLPIVAVQYLSGDVMSVSCFDREDETFIVLINQEEQYSIWPEWKAVPVGWQAVAGVQGDKAHVQSYINEHWTDMRPASLRQWMAEQAQQGDA
ncbi:MbtH family protein [Pseudoalteromonas sp. NC201]|uniref:MbtH family protein n=1 Tax=Pseudoalteromonas sp. NC201 TaxID=1514074 RepID=UPI003FA399F3